MLDQNAYQKKFKNFIKMIDEALNVEEKPSVIIVANKGVLGDTDEEYQESLRRLNHAGLNCHSIIDGALH